MSGRGRPQPPRWRYDPPATISHSRSGQLACTYRRPPVHIPSSDFGPRPVTLVPVPTEQNPQLTALTQLFRGRALRYRGSLGAITGLTSPMPRRSGADHGAAGTAGDTANSRGTSRGGSTATRRQPTPLSGARRSSGRGGCHDGYARNDQGHVRMTEPDVQRRSPRGRPRKRPKPAALADVGLDGDEAALDIRDLRSPRGCIRLGAGARRCRTAFRMNHHCVSLAAARGHRHQAQDLRRQPVAVTIPSIAAPYAPGP